MTATPHEDESGPAGPLDKLMQDLENLEHRLWCETNYNRNEARWWDY